MTFYSKLWATIIQNYVDEYERQETLTKTIKLKQIKPIFTKWKSLSASKNSNKKNIIIKNSLKIQKGSSVSSLTQSAHLDS